MLNIHSLRFMLFKQIILSGDLSLLPAVKEEEREVVWQIILEQYAVAIGEEDRDGYLADRRELAYFQTQRMLVDTLVDVLRKFYIDKWAKILGRIVKMRIVYTDREDLYQQLDAAVTRSRGIIDLNLAELTSRVEQHEKKNEGSNLVPTEDFFARVLINLHEFSSWQFNDNELTVFQYCELLVRYRQHSQFMDSKKRAA